MLQVNKFKTLQYRITIEVEVRDSFAVVNKICLKEKIPTEFYQ